MGLALGVWVTHMGNELLRNHYSSWQMMSGRPSGVFDAPLISHFRLLGNVIIKKKKYEILVFIAYGITPGFK